MENKKVTTVEIIFGSLITLFIDTLSALVDLTGVGLVVSPIIQGATTFSINIFFKTKGSKTNKKLGSQITKYASNVLPIIPTTLAIFLISSYVHNHPKNTIQITTV